ncbi:MAG: MarR family transcriptional regulator [Betaproteobacteria bacterium]|nr:MarR family transcriptional regulator [Betaproteobacteria bacterium]
MARAPSTAGHCADARALTHSSRWKNSGMTSNAMSTKLGVRVSSQADALDRFEAAWHLASGRSPPAPLAVLSFADLPLLLSTLTPARWKLLQQLQKSGPVSIYALAKALGRDYKNVHTDVVRLLELGLIERSQDALVRVTWDAVRTELRLRD